MYNLSWTPPVMFVGLQSHPFQSLNMSTINPIVSLVKSVLPYLGPRRTLPVGNNCLEFIETPKIQSVGLGGFGDEHGSHQWAKCSKLTVSSPGRQVWRTRHGYDRFDCIILYRCVMVQMTPCYELNHPAWYRLASECLILFYISDAEMYEFVMICSKIGYTATNWWSIMFSINDGHKLRGNSDFDPFAA